jgi:hypothetical protein
MPARKQAAPSAGFATALITPLGRIEQRCMVMALLSPAPRLRPEDVSTERNDGRPD